MFRKQTIKDVDLNQKVVLLRADYNVPLDGEKITDDFRIQASLPTIDYLLKQNVKLIICSHLGRPNGKRDIRFSLFPVAKRLQSLLNNVSVEFVADCVGEEVNQAVDKLDFGQVLLLENLRFHPEEEQNNFDFAKSLASLAEFFVQDGFGVVHRAHASTEAITHCLPSYAGLLLEKEVETIESVMLNPTKPLMAIIGGAKITDKIDILHRFIEIADYVAIGGAMANTFLAAQGVEIGNSLFDPKELSIARDIIRKSGAQSKKRNFALILPFDVVVSKAIDNKLPTRIIDLKTHTYSQIINYPKRPPIHDVKVLKDDIILDIGPFSASFMAGVMQTCQTVIWNGTMGVTEVDSLIGFIGPFAHGTELLIEAMTGDFYHTPYSLVGGGDTIGYLSQRQLIKCFDHVSTGGGASLELMGGRKLPGVEALLNRDN